MDSIDVTVEPCDDFYRFACGQYIDNAVIADDKIWYTTYTVLSDQLQLRLKNTLEENIQENETKPTGLVKEYYQACINKGKMRMRY